MNNLPNDIILSIMKMNRINHENDIYKKRHNLFIKHIEEYCEEYEESISPEIIKDSNMRCDIRFLEYNDCWGTSFENCIVDKHGEQEVDYFCDNYF